MRVTVERVRRWVLWGALLLVVIVAGIIGFARYRLHRMLTDLPKQLGADIRSETNGFTWSQSNGKKTLFTIHASKAVQRQDGKYTLHDVGIILYGGTGTAKQNNRTDRIYGKEFEYDQKNGVVTAVGEVHLDLQAPGGVTPDNALVAMHDKDVDSMIHVRTSGLVFMQKLGVAATDEPIDFHTTKVEGDARGAEYDSDSGMLILRKEVHLRSLEAGKRADVTATHAEVDRVQRKAVLTHAFYRADHQTAQAERVLMDLREDGSVERAHAEGGVILEDEKGQRMQAPSAEIAISKESHPQMLRATGGVHFTGPSATGEATSLETSFDGKGNAQQAILDGGVRAHFATPLQVRALSARQVVLQFAKENKANLELRHIVATGAARVTTTATPKSKGGNSLLAAETLQADIAGETKHRFVSRITGNGNTQLEETLPDGTLRRSTSDTLDARLPAPTSGKKKQAQARQLPPLDSAIQQGNVVILDKPGKTQAGQLKSAEETHATAQRAEYDNAADSVVLTGSPRIDSAGTNLTADRILIHRTSGDAVATGSVKGSYSAGAGREPVHVLALRATMQRKNSSASFFGSPGVPARLWEATSQVEAPVIDLDQAKQTLHAHAEAVGGAAAVRTSLVNNERAAVAGRPSKPPTVTRMTSADLLYRGNLTQPTAEFTGGVLLNNIDGTIQSDTVTAFMKPSASVATPTQKKDAATLFSGGVERILAQGNVRLQQTGRTGTGTRLTYTAADGAFNLTGTADTPPKIMDGNRGSITGASLLFHSGDDSVIVAGAPGERVRAETRIKR
jgi:lipopolysaccharide export system protein LptA